MKVAIVGSRDYHPALDVCLFVDTLATEDEVVSGGARGPDTWAAVAAAARGLKVKVFPADWSTGRGAGFARNQQIVDYADKVVAFWDGKSRGTEHTISLARKAGKPVEVIIK